MDDITTSINQAIDRADVLTEAAHPFYSFEPFDVAKRPDWVIERAREDGIDLYSNKWDRHIGRDPHPFQSGLFFSNSFLTIMLAGSQNGKSISVLVYMILVTTGEIPFAFRYPKGVSTGIKRRITPENIIRFGRRDSSTGKLIDHDPSAPTPEGWSEWDCGCIEGAGVFPSDKILPYGSEVRIGTFQKAKIEFWWPRIAEKRKMLIPKHLINTKRGAGGYNKQDGQVYFSNESLWTFITYEMEAKKFEAESVPLTILDEEPENEKIVATVASHTSRGGRIILAETPYHGITYTDKLIFPDEVTSHSTVFHCTSYDSPYKTPEMIQNERRTMNRWELGARLWGVPTASGNDPYFNRNKIGMWIQKYKFIPYERIQFETARPYYRMISDKSLTNIPGLIDSKVLPIKCGSDDKQNVWHVFEEPRKGVGYLGTADPAIGSDHPEGAMDMSAGIIARAPIDDEKKPVIVATIRSTWETIRFAHVFARGLRYFNNAMLAPEAAVRGAANATFVNELNDWPYWFYFETTNEATGKVQSKKGFDTNASTRESMFDLIKDHIGGFEADEYPYIPDMELLQEMYDAVVVKMQSGKFKCDHSKNGTLDSVIAFGIMLFVFKFKSDQIKCNVAEPVKPKRNRHEELVRPMCNLGGLGFKSGVKYAKK